MSMESSEDILETARKSSADPVTRRAVAKESFFWFFHIYFPHYIKYQTALFQREIIDLLQNDSEQMLAIVAFRGSGKSTIITMAYVLWAILGKQQKKFAIIAGLTQRQARQLFTKHKTRTRQQQKCSAMTSGRLREEQDSGVHFLLLLQTTAQRLLHPQRNKASAECVMDNTGQILFYAMTLRI